MGHREGANNLLLIETSEQVIKENTGTSLSEGGRIGKTGAKGQHD